MIVTAFFLTRRAAKAALFVFCVAAFARDPVTAKSFMVAAAHPLAVEAGYEILKRGGSAMDAAIAVQMALGLAEPVLEVLSSEIGAKGVAYDRDVAKVSLIGAGMKSHPGVAADMFEALGEAGINIEIISTSSIRVSCVVRAAEAQRAVNVVHERLQLADDVLYEAAAP